MRIVSKLVTIVLIVGLNTDVWAYSDADYIIPTGKNQFKVMNYNVQNLFDADHDNGKEDWEFLPIDSPLKINCYPNQDPKKSTGRNYCAETDWTEEKIVAKLKQIKKVIDAQGDLPDILTVQEVENPHIVGRLSRYLGFDGFYMTDSPDVRGIDVAILYRTEKLDPIGFEEYVIKDALKPTRNLAVGHFKLKKSLGGRGVLAIYPNHWPSQGTKTPKARLIPAQQLVEIIQENKRKFRGQAYYVVATGDFNTLEDETPNAVEDVLLDPKYGLFDMYDLAEAYRNPMLNKMPPASYYYGKDDNWNEFDRIVISKNLIDEKGVDAEPRTFRIHAPKFLTKTNSRGEAIPFRYNHHAHNPKWLGYSDHFGVVVRFTYEPARLQDNEE